MSSAASASRISHRAKLWAASRCGSTTASNDKFCKEAAKSSARTNRPGSVMRVAAEQDRGGDGFILYAQKFSGLPRIKDQGRRSPLRQVHATGADHMTTDSP